jgi:hypothetical protein
MFDDLRQQAGTGDLEKPEEEQDVYSFKDRPRSPSENFLGMTPGQRFVLACMLLMMICIISVLGLLVMEKIYPPFL